VTVALLAGTCMIASVLMLAAAAADRGVLARADPPSVDEAAGRRARRPKPSTRAKSLVVAAVGASIGWVVAGPPGLVGGFLVLAAIPIMMARRRSTRRAARIQEQLIDAVTAIASALRAGRSLVQSLEVAAGEVGDPLGGLLSDVVDRAALGVPVDEVLDDLATQVGGPDARLVTGVLRLHRRTGGALAASLDDLVRTLRARRDGARELGSLTAQARLSAAILGLLPFGFFLFLSVVARRDVEAAYRSAAGASAIGIGLALQGAAFVWIRSLLRVEDR
jgi:tight adherence protein B